MLLLLVFLFVCFYTKVIDDITITSNMIVLNGPNSHRVESEVICQADSFKEKKITTDPFINLVLILNQQRADQKGKKIYQCSTVEK